MLWCARTHLRSQGYLPRAQRCGVQANSEVSALLGRIPSAVGYQPTLATDLGGLQERITTTKKGSITSVQVLQLFRRLHVPWDAGTLQLLAPRHVATPASGGDSSGQCRHRP